MKVLSEGICKQKRWVISAFSIVREDENSYPASDPYPYRLFRDDDFITFIDPEKEGDLTQIVDSNVSEALFKFNEAISLNAGDVINLKESVKTTVGRALFNQVVLGFSFGDKIPYQNQRINIKDIEKMIVGRLADDPETLPPMYGEEGFVGGEKSPIYVSEYLKFAKAVSSLTGYTQLCVPGLSEKAITVRPDMAEIKQRLLEKYKDRLHDPAAIAEIEKELIKADREWLEGDSSMGFFINKKDIDLKRKKAMVIHGVETGFKEGNEIDFIANALSEGWDTRQIPAMMNSLREGSYSRGKETAKGGASVKDFMRIFQNTKISVDDCGTVLGRPRLITKDNYMDFVGYYQVVNAKPVRLDEERLTSNIGKVITIRSPMYCKAEEPTFCAKCLGDLNSENPKSLGAAVSNVGSTFMSIQMAGAHARALETAIWDFEEMLT